MSERKLAPAVTSFTADGAHVLRTRVYYEDTDAGGVVYHANYLRFAERGRTEYLRDAGVSQSELSDEEGVFFVVRRSVIDFRLPARLDDALDIVTRIAETKGASFEVAQEIRKAGTADYLVRVDSTIACLDRKGRPVRVPKSVRAKLDRQTMAGTNE
ncbi:tol-pal system-associated acyl-CoA thioesterase [Nisaea acidiphila]|uniref:Tol-pal system-associated acyl-CoA thioesterase n=1 Tax=Nisaea acidiphila TaxID=1862145 RepID=A0A9J7AQZ9_9PROT|nr:tol-pal system-associated acyl-CoA thioesterase [Nisaea acidiphila]UUX48772.1 tol-pal system-associated acyl-CoA thioesterase [Nisaea acidiphila]